VFTGVCVVCALRSGPPTWGLGEGLTTPHHENYSLLRNVLQGLALELILWKNLGSISMNGRDNSEDQSVDGKIILEWILGKQGVK
jgi:hypothetical protein